MRAILRTGFGGPEVLVIREIPEPEPKDGHAVIEVKAFGLNHAELHMRKGEWAEIADVSGIECVGVVKSCPGGEFAPGTKVAALMGGLGRTINGSYAEYTRAPVTNVAAIESGLSWADLAAIPETYATAWTCLFRNLEIAPGQTLVIRGATSSFGQAALNMAVNAGAKVIATTRSRDRFPMVEALRRGPGGGRGAGPFQTDRRGREDRCRARPGRQQHDPRFPRDAAPGRPRLPGRVAGRPCADRRLQPAGADGERRLPDLLRQLRVRQAGLPAVGRAPAGDRGRRGGRPSTRRSRRACSASRRSRRRTASWNPMRPRGRWSSSTINQRGRRAGMPLPSLQTRTRSNDRKPSVIVFDVNETLIDIEALSPLFERVFGDGRVLREWFGQLVLYSMTTTLSGLYEDFFSLGRGVFEMVGAVHGVAVEAADVEALGKACSPCPPIPMWRRG